MTDPMVHVVHCIDTEGPLHESLAATFARLHDIFGLDLEPNRELLARLQRGEVDLGGREEAVQRVVAPHLLAYNDTWDRVDAMLGECLAPEFRDRAPDSLGGGWVYSWFCVDHVDHEENPRRRDLGYHNVFDHYAALLREAGCDQDGLHFHYHPHAFGKAAHHCATHWWANSDSLAQVLARRIIDRHWFPAANRPGFHVTRPDSHWFLEQHVPFDFASQAVELDPADRQQADSQHGRLGDWRRAPVTWEPYHPDHDDYQVPGRCRRWIARCLNVGTRFRLLRERDVRQAFAEAREGKPVVLAVTNHDFRDMRPDIDGVRSLLATIAAEFPDVRYRHAEAVDAMRQALRLPAQPACELDLEVKAGAGDAHVVTIRTTTPTFGPQPWLALRTRAGTYHHDNLDIEMPFRRWTYTLDAQTFPLDALDALGVGACNAHGVATVTVLDPRTGRTRRKTWNEP